MNDTTKITKLLEKRSGTKKAVREKRKKQRKLWNGCRPAVMQDKRRKHQEKFMMEEETDE